jgi:DegV family protein with EDD domain
MALEAGKMAKEGKTIDEILERLNYNLNTRKVYFGVETLDYLKKGGRIKTTTAVIGGMLDIRPLLSIKDGLVVAIDKVKGEKKLLSKIAMCIEEDVKDNPNYMVYILNSDSSGPCETIKTLFDEKGIKYEKETIAVGSVIGSHAGPGVYGFLVVFD